MNDIVYFCKDVAENEEFVYSVRSAVANFPHRKIWVYGGCPKNMDFGDTYCEVNQSGLTKWDKVRAMFRLAALNNDITEDFYLFNDDFYIMQPLEEMPVLYRGPLSEHILDIEGNRHDNPSDYTKQLRKVYRELKSVADPVLSYELHVPFLFNRKKLLEIIKTYPQLRVTRTMYGNLYKIGGDRMQDVKFYGSGLTSSKVVNKSRFFSTDDLAWRNDTMLVKHRIKKAFPDKSPYEL